jgi:diguanylate cyclase
MPYIVSQNEDWPDRNESGLVAGVFAPPGGGERAEMNISASALGLLSIEDFYLLCAPIVEEYVDDGRPCCIAIVDIDRLHRLNDAHGTACAQAVLSKFAANLKQVASTRSMPLGHLGLDRFAVLMTGVAGAAAADGFEELRQELISRPIPWQNEVFNLTVSVGLAEIQDRETFDNYLNAAEQFLFMAKMAGRNHVLSDHSFLSCVR